MPGARNGFVGTDRFESEQGASCLKCLTTKPNAIWKDRPSASRRGQTLSFSLVLPLLSGSGLRGERLHEGDRIGSMNGARSKCPALRSLPSSRFMSAARDGLPLTFAGLWERFTNQCKGPSGCQLRRLFASWAANRFFATSLACCSPTSGEPARLVHLPWRR